MDVLMMFVIDRDREAILSLSLSNQFAQGLDVVLATILKTILNDPRTIFMGAHDDEIFSNVG